jgi:hypothetical protein
MPEDVAMARIAGMAFLPQIGGLMMLLAGREARAHHRHLTRRALSLAVSLRRASMTGGWATLGHFPSPSVLRAALPELSL